MQAFFSQTHHITDFSEDLSSLLKSILDLLFFSYFMVVCRYCRSSLVYNVSYYPAFIKLSQIISDAQLSILDQASHMLLLILIQEYILTD